MRNLLSHRSGGQKSEIRCLQGWVLLGTVREDLFYASVLASGGLLAISGVPWLVEPSPSSLPAFLPACVSVSKFSL